jgi:hypothetical protein
MQRAVTLSVVLAVAVLAACGGEPGDPVAGSGPALSPPPSPATLTCTEGGGAAPNRPGLPTGYVELDPRRDVVSGPLSFAGATDRARSPTSDYEPVGLERLRHGWPDVAPDNVPAGVREHMRERSLYAADEMAFVVRGDRAVTVEIPEPERAHASLLFDTIRFRWNREDAEFLERFGLAQVSDGRPAVRVEPCGASPTLFGRGLVVAGTRCLPLNVWVEGEEEPLRALISFGAGECGRAVLSPDWTTHRSAKWGYTVSFPATWQRAERPVTPRLTEPREILSLGTFPLRHRPTNCEAFAGSAREDLGPADAFLTILERGFDHNSEWLEFPRRPKRFGPTPENANVAEPACGDRPGTDVRWFNFTDAGRHFHVLLVAGADAPPEVREEAWRILNALRLDAGVEPDWPASG